DFVRIMTEPENALTKQYAALCAAEGATLEFTSDGIKEVARIAAKANERMENIGARRLHTVMTTLLEEVLFNLPDFPEKHIVFDGQKVRDRLARIVDHAEVEQLAQHATVPVINGLTDLSHPGQVLADLFTVREAVGGWEGKRVAWVGDGNNMANSWIEAAQVLGFELRLACPEGYEPNRRIFDRAKQGGACIEVTEIPEEAVEGAHVVNTDVWASMGQEAEAQARTHVGVHD